MSVNRLGLAHKRQTFLVQITLKDDHNSEGSINTIMLIVDYKDQTSKASQGISGTEVTPSKVAPSSTDLESIESEESLAST
jgi:hypothetical protein